MGNCFRDHKPSVKQGGLTLVYIQDNGKLRGCISGRDNSRDHFDSSLGGMYE